MRKIVGLSASILGLATLAACADETVARYGGADRVWTLTELDGAPFAASATLIFPERGRIAGAAPCNQYTGANTVPYPWFQAEQVAVTRRACPDMAAEATFLGALSDMTQSEVFDDTLVLRSDTGRALVFTSGGVRL